MSTVHGFPNSLTDFGGNNSDPRYLAAAKAIGARVDTSNGNLYDLKDGHRINQTEADQKANQFGVAIDSNRQRGGFLNQVYDRNKSIIDPVLELGATALGGPLAGAAVSSGLNYANTHDLGQAAIAGAENYGLSKLGSAASKIPGVSTITNGLGDAGRYLENNIPGLSQIADSAGDVGSWLKSAGGDVQSALDKAGIKLPSLAALTGGAGGMSGDNLLGLAGVANSAYLQDKANNYAENAAKNAQMSYDERAPLRTAGLAGMQAAPKTLPALSTIRTRGNPFAQGT